MGGGGLRKTVLDWDFETGEMTEVHRWVSLAAEEAEGTILGHCSSNPDTIHPESHVRKGIPNMPALARMVSRVGLSVSFQVGAVWEPKGNS